MIDEPQLRGALRRRADSIPAVPSDPTGSVSRAERRATRTVILGVVVIIALCVSAIAGASAVRERSVPIKVPASLSTPTPTPPDLPDRLSADRYPELSSPLVPPQGSEPSLPEVGQQVLQFGVWYQEGATSFDAHVYQDGRIVWNCLETCPAYLEPPTDAQATGVLEQQLTQAGVELLREKLMDTGLFDGESNGKRSVGSVVDYLDAGVVVNGKEIKADASPNQALGYPPLPTKAQQRGFEELQHIVLSPDLTLPDVAWEDRGVRAFIPSYYCIWFYPKAPDSWSDLPHPADRLVAQKFAQITTDEARNLAMAFQAQGLSPHDRGGVAYPLALPGRHRTTWMYLEVRLPGDGCG